MGSYNGKTALVTGGASGIGRALCEALAQRGAFVVVTDVDGEGAATVARAITARGGRASTSALDVRDAAAFEAIVAATAAQHGGLDYLFNNAGLAVLGEERDVSLDDWKRVLDVDLLGVVHGVRAAYPLMVRQSSGHIVNIASLAGLVPTPLAASYSAAKHGVVGLSHALRAEGARLGVKVSVVCPGFIDTPIFQISPIRAAIERADLLSLNPKPMPPARCAEIILDGVLKNRGVIPVTAFAHVVWALHRLSPAITHRMAVGVLDRVRALRTDR
jgi:NAD(P)-dependent dehydrogenase (short-subunit alcohol dehydrogenase family)